MKRTLLLLAAMALLLPSCAPFRCAGRALGINRAAAPPRAISAAPSNEYEAIYQGERNKLLLELSRGKGVGE